MPDFGGHEIPYFDCVNPEGALKRFVKSRAVYNLALKALCHGDIEDWEQKCPKLKQSVFVLREMFI